MRSAGMGTELAPYPSNAFQTPRMRSQRSRAPDCVRGRPLRGMPSIDDHSAPGASQVPRPETCRANDPLVAMLLEPDVYVCRRPGCKDFWLIDDVLVEERVLNSDDELAGLAVVASKSYDYGICKVHCDLHQG